MSATVPQVTTSPAARYGWDPLGVTPDGSGGANVALWAKGADAVELCAFDEDGTERRFTLDRRVFNVFHGHVPDLAPGARYGFRVYGPWDPEHGLRWNPAKLLLDPYAKAIDGEFALHPSVFGHAGTDDRIRDDFDSAAYVPKSVVVDGDFDWQGDTQLHTRWGDTVIYEAHVRGLTMQSRYVPEHLRGTYAGLAHPSVIDYLVNLGVTALELMPVHHFVDEIHLLKRGLPNYWGYNSIGFLAPHARYSSTGSRGGQVQEFKSMVRSLHQAGIEVILDVVYNHTAEGDEFGPTLSFRGIANDDYYRLRDGRHYADYTGCGNTLDASHPHVLQLIMDSLRYWVTEMHVDGFRFDLASALARSMHDVDMLGSFLSTIQQDPVLRRVKLIAEPWDVGPGGYQVGEFPPLWAEWNDKFRDTVRDFWRGAAGIGDLGWRLTGSADLYSNEGRRPFASVNFVTAHDGFTMRDLVSYDHKHNEANLEDNRDGSDDNRSWNCGVEGETDDPAVLELRQRQMRNLMLTLLVSAGVPMLVAGDEFGRTQQGNNNAYCQDNELSWLDWDWQPWQVTFHRFTQDLLTLRAQHRVFRTRTFFSGQPVRPGGPPDISWIGPDGRALHADDWADPTRTCLGMLLSGELARSDPGRQPFVGEAFLVLVSNDASAVTCTLPDPGYAAGYVRVVDTATGVVDLNAGERAGERDDIQVLRCGDTVVLPPKSALVMQVLRTPLS